MADKAQWITVKRLPQSDWPSRMVLGTWEKQIEAEHDGVRVPIGIIRYCCELQDTE